jgi:hypothetical protein
MTAGVLFDSSKSGGHRPTLQLRHSLSESDSSLVSMDNDLSLSTTAPESVAVAIVPLMTLKVEDLVEVTPL